MPDALSERYDRSRIDPDFLALPVSSLADAALAHAQRIGADYADFRLTRIRRADWLLRDAVIAATSDTTDVAYGVRVMHQGNWGFASAMDLRTTAVVEAVDQALAMARLAAQINGSDAAAAAQWTDEPVYRDAVWCSGYQVDPFAVPDVEKIEVLATASAALLKHPAVSHTEAVLRVVREAKFYADLRGTSTTQQSIRLHPVFTAVAARAGSGRARTLRTIGPPAARGWEYVLGTGWNWADELAELPELLAEKALAPSVRPGRYDLVIDPTNLALTIHESIGHATELDRVLGHEAAFAGTSFATRDQLGTLDYGAKGMRVTADRIAPHGLATAGYDDEGVKAQSWNLIDDGVLVGYQTDRDSAARVGAARSTGCAYAESARHVQLQRMANVSLRPEPQGPDLAGLIAGVERGIYVVGDNSWSIDARRNGFQFTGQQFHRIECGRLAGQLNDVAYRGNTVKFWNSLLCLGGPATYLLSGSFNCGKGQPVQAAPVSHGSPAAAFANIDVTSTATGGT